MSATYLILRTVDGSTWWLHALWQLQVLGVQLSQDEPLVLAHIFDAPSVGAAEAKLVEVQDAWHAAQPKHFLASDDDGHWYVVPVSRRAEWDTWCSLDADDERAWDPPSFAKGVDGPHRVTFEAPEVSR